MMKERKGQAVQAVGRRQESNACQATKQRLRRRNRRGQYGLDYDLRYEVSPTRLEVRLVQGHPGFLHPILTQEGARLTKRSGKLRPSMPPRPDVDPAFHPSGTSPAGRSAAEGGKPFLPTRRYNEFLDSPKCSRSPLSSPFATRRNRRFGLKRIRPRSHPVASSQHLPWWRSPDTVTKALCS